jgi:tRNA(Ile)-lysidine synthase
VRGFSSFSQRIDGRLLRPGMRLGVGVSGGADSVALLRALAERRSELGLVLHVAHLHHGLRGEAADGDQQFVGTLAAGLGLEFHTARVDVAAEAAKSGESLEEAGRRLRYAWFRELMATVPLDAVATAHTRDDQAETVLLKFLRGAWTEGFSGIHPEVSENEGRIVRPLLGVTRSEIESYLKQLGQSWREDATNRALEFTRNRIRHELLPELERWNPQMREKLVQMAELAREEESWWSAEIDRLAGQLLLRGKAVRGGGRAATTEEAEAVALDRTRLAVLAVAVQRRLLRRALRELGGTADFAGIEALRRLALEGAAGEKLELAGGLRAERTPRELQLRRKGPAAEALPEYSGSVPGILDATAFGVRLRIGAEADAVGKKAVVRLWRPGDRARLRYSSGPRKVSEILDRMKVTGTDRQSWPVLVVEKRVVWLRGAVLEPEAGISVEELP